MKISHVLGLCALLLATTAGIAAAEPPANFARGVNLSHWLQYDGRQPVRAADMSAIRAAGFDHVRIPFDPVLLGWQPLVVAPSGDLAMPSQQRLEDAVDMALAANLAVIVDFHPATATEELIEGNQQARDSFVELWSRLARRLASRPANRVAFEIMNEPQYYERGATAWNVLQSRAATAIRAVAPKNLLLLSPIHGSELDALARLAPIDDANSCTVFHFYDPQLLTHLGADWDPYPDKAQGMMRGLVYPSSAMTMSKVEMLPNANIRLVGQAVLKYLGEGWNGKHIAERIDIAKQWAAEHHSCLVASEFGVLRGTLDPASRNAWLVDVRSAFEHAGIGWTVWDYADVFGIATGSGSVARLGGGATQVLDAEHFTRDFDPAALHALGLTP